MTKDYHGLPVQQLSNRLITLEYLAEAGPRIVRLYLNEAQHNLLAETPEMSWPTPYGTYSTYGGHRLWHSPEAFPRSYIPDDHGLNVEEVAGGVRLSRGPEEGSGISKSLDIRLDGDDARVVLDHTLKNEGLWPVELAVWCLTQLNLGGTAILPQTAGQVDERGLLPNRNLVLWPYTSWLDDRLEFHDDLILLHARPALPPCKLGHLNPHGWLAYLNEDVLFVKRFEHHPGQPYPDFGCNSETYCNDTTIELESLSPLVKLEPGAEVAHREIWTIIPLQGHSVHYESIQAMIKEFGL